MIGWKKIVKTLVFRSLESRRREDGFQYDLWSRNQEAYTHFCNKMGKRPRSCEELEAVMGKWIDWWHRGKVVKERYYSGTGKIHASELEFGEIAIESGYYYRLEDRGGASCVWPHVTLLCRVGTYKSEIEESGIKIDCDYPELLPDLDVDLRGYWDNPVRSDPDWVDPVLSPSQQARLLAGMDQGRCESSLEDKAYGCIYMLSNPSMPNLLKIGYTSGRAEDRAAQLSCMTGVPDPFIVERSYRVRSLDLRFAEEQVHEALRAFRLRSNREFFKITVDQANEIIFSILKRLGFS